jgi:imipenem/basic amino acid-specific outer membrane pore
MKIKKWSLLALAIAAATTQLSYAADAAMANDDSKDIGTEQLAQSMKGSSQGQSKGFIEDSSLTLESRNFGYYRNFKNTAPDTQNYQNEWGQAEMLNFTSGYTQGTVGFGVDAFANGAVRLSGGGGTGSTQVLPSNSNNCDAVTGSCQGQDAYGRAGGAVKVRISETELKIGDQKPQSPVFGTWDGYLMPQYVNGGLFSSNEISGLALQGGHFTSGTADNSTNRDGNLGTTYGYTRVDSASYIGGDYSFSDTLSGGLHAANYEDVWNQYYADLFQTWTISEDLALNTSIAYYKTDDAGDSSAGKINNDSFSMAMALTTGAHTFTLAHQRINGNTPFDYLAVSGDNGADNSGARYYAGGSIWLANSSQWSDFNAPGEKSYKLQYNLDASILGVPGLSFMVRYMKGTDADGTGADANGAYSFERAIVDGEEWERDIEVAYVVQNGPAKDLSFKIRQATYRGNSDANINAGADEDEIRMITSYPLNIF